MARALGPDGRLISLEADARHAEVARLNVDRAGLTEKVEIWIGSAIDLLPKVAASGGGPFDFSFIDADKANIPEYVDWAVKLSRPGALILVDNVIRHGAVIEQASTDEDVLGVQKMHESLAADRRVLATSIQTVGAKGYDGFTLIVVKES
jgi:predicted O-methyltransferase YrrM